MVLRGNGTQTGQFIWDLASYKYKVPHLICYRFFFFFYFGGRIHGILFLLPECRGGADVSRMNITLIYCVEVTAVHILLICQCRIGSSLTQVSVIKISYLDVPLGTGGSVASG